MSMISWLELVSRIEGHEDYYWLVNLQTKTQVPDIGKGIAAILQIPRRDRYVSDVSYEEFCNQLVEHKQLIRANRSNLYNRKY